MINQPNSVDQPILTNQEKMVKGSAWMTASNIISRMLGRFTSSPPGTLGWASTETKRTVCFQWGIRFMPYS